MLLLRPAFFFLLPCGVGVDVVFYTMPTLITETQTLLRVVLPNAVYQHYLAEAAAAGKDIETVLAARLEACQDYSAEKPIYFDDADRQELERCLGRNVLHTADALIQIRNALSVRVNKVIISLNPNLLGKLKSRCIRADWEKWLSARIVHALEVYVGLR